MRILHTSDWHLGQSFYGKSRADEHQAFLTWLLEQVQTQHIDAVIVAGDIFDTGTPPSYAREMYFNFVALMHETGCELIVLAGNHDSVAMLSESKALLTRLSAKVISTAQPASTADTNEQVFYLYGKERKDDNKKSQPKAVLCAIPYIRPRDIVQSQAGQSALDKQQSLQLAIKNHYQALFEQAQILANVDKSITDENITDACATIPKNLPIIATGHLTTLGVTLTESVREIYIGTLEAFPASEFPNADYIALGHIHRAQKVAKTEHIRYCGSPIALSFDEANQDKKVLLVEFKQVNDNESSNVNVTELVIPCFQPLVMVKTSLEQVSASVKCAVENTLLPAGKKLWLDIEINSHDYLQDLQNRIEHLIADYPVEILLVRRSKKSRDSMPNSQKKVTLSELTLDDVFHARMSREQWDNEDELNRKSRLTTLFKQAVETVSLALPAEDESKGKSKPQTKAEVKSNLT